MATRKPDPIDIEVGQRIRIQRLASGMSQTDLGEQIGVTFQQVQKYEKGANRVGAGRLTKIANVLEVPVESFFNGRDTIERASHQHGVASPLELMTHPYAFRLLQAYATITDGDIRRSIVELVEKIAAKQPAPAKRGKGSRRH